MGPYDKFDLLIKSGDVIDPSQSLRDKRDIGIRYGLIEAVEPDISAACAYRIATRSWSTQPRTAPAAHWEGNVFSH
jgi:dihydroorotase